MPAVRYPDRWLRILVLPLWSILFRHIGEPAPLVELLRNPYYYADLLVVWVVSALIWWYNRWLIIRLDQRYSWFGQTLPRLLLQAVLAYTVTGLFVLLISFIYNDLILQRPAPFSLTVIFVTDVPTSLLFITILHLGYTLYWLVAYHKQTVAELHNRLAVLEADRQPIHPAEGRPTGVRTLLVNQGKGFVPVETDQIAYIYITNELSLVRTADSKSYTVDATLEQLSERLPGTDFFRLNRQFIAHRKAIRKVEHDGTGRLLLHLQPAYAEEVAVSRRRVPEFRQWMEAATQVG